MYMTGVKVPRVCKFRCTWLHVETIYVRVDGCESGYVYGKQAEEELYPMLHVYIISVNMIEYMSLYGTLYVWVHVHTTCQECMSGTAYSHVLMHMYTHTCIHTWVCIDTCSSSEVASMPLTHIYIYACLDTWVAIPSLRCPLVCFEALRHFSICKYYVCCMYAMCILRQAYKLLYTDCNRPGLAVYKVHINMQWP